MKKLLSIGLAAMLAFGLATTSFAEEARDVTTPTDGIVTIHKVYKLENAGTKSPAETFTLEQVDKGVVKDGEAKTAPDLGTITGAEFAEGAATVDGTTGDITVALPEYTNVGVYEYTLKEVDGKTAGVVYYPDDIKLVVTVINGENGKLRIAAVHVESEGTKSDTFPNTYSAGSLKVTKTVEGNMGNKDKYFKFTVTLNAPENKEVKSAIGVGSTSYTSNPTSITVGTATDFYLKDGETLSFTNVPYGVTYTVVEANEDYTTTVNGTAGVEVTGTIEHETTTAAYVNTKTGDVDTGVVLNNMPYILVLAVLAAGVAVFIIRKRRED